MELDYRYITVRVYKKPKKGQYRDEECIVDQIDSVFNIRLTEEENVAFAENEYTKIYLKNPNHEVVGSISAMYKGMEVSDDKVADAEIEAELFKSTES
jgi:hypothetical protein